MYKAIEYFTDNQDNGYAYNVGDEYPRQGYEPTEERIQELLSSKNKRHRPVIAINDKGEKTITEDQETAETVADVVAEETAENVPENDFEDIDEKPRKRKKREE